MDIDPALTMVLRMMDFYFRNEHRINDLASDPAEIQENKLARGFLFSLKQFSTSSTLNDFARAQFFYERLNQNYNTIF